MNAEAPLYIGLISGTSVDGIDAGLFSFSQDLPKLLETYEQEFSPEQREEILALCKGTVSEIDRAGKLDRILGELFGQTALKLIDKADIEATQVAAIGSHGQTIRHRPSGEYPFSCQIADPNTIAQVSGITTVADFRRRDIACGGQGAPLAPAFHQAVFNSDKEKRCIANIGGMANISVLNSDSTRVIGYDTGPGNVLMDAWIFEHLHKNYDRNGDWGASGEIHNDLLYKLLEHPYFALPAPKSTGREHFKLDWLEEILHDFERIAAADVQATLCELTAQSLAKEVVQHDVEALFLCGGGAHNDQLYHKIRAHLPETRVSTTDELGIPPDWVEAGLFAWLAHQSIQHLPGNLPSVTGASSSVILGGIFPA